MNEPVTTNGAVRFGESLFAWVLETSWQAGILALVIVFAQTVFRRRLSPAWRYGLWYLLIVRLLLPSTPQTSWSIYNLAGRPVALTTVERPSDSDLFAPPFAPMPGVHETPDPASESPGHRISELPINVDSDRKKSPLPTVAFTFPWRRLAFFIWLFLGGFFAVRLVWSNSRFSHAVNNEPRVTGGPALLLLNACRDKLGISQPVALIETTAVQSPSVYGFWRKRLLLPEGTLQEFSADELRCVFLHELAHIKRRDLEVNWLASLLLAIHWFNPLLWLAFARMRNDREMACDALALTQLGTSQTETYGQVIIKVVANFVRPFRSSGVLALSEDKERLKERIRMIAAFKQRPRWSVLALSLVLGIAAIGLTNSNPAPSAASSNLPGAADPSAPPNNSAALLPKGIHVKVVDALGEPVRDADVKCQGFDWRTSTDSRGRFSWIGADQSRTFQIQKAGFRTLFSDLLVPSQHETVLRLKSALAVSGRVIDKETRQPVSKFEVYHVQLLQGSITPSLRPRERMQGGSGAFTYAFPYSIWPDSAFYIEAEGYRPNLSPPLIAASNGKELIYELARSQPVAGMVLTPGGAPASKAEVRLWCGEYNLSDIPPNHKSDADSTGAFSLPAILDGKLLVYHNSGFAELPWKEFLTTQRVQLVEWGRVKGRWPKPLPKNRSISLERIRWSGENNAYTFPPPWRIAGTQIKADGSFEFEEGVPPGEYVLGEFESLRVNWPGGGYSVMGLVTKRVSVSVDVGVTTTVEVPPGRTVVGRIDLGDDQSITNVHLPIVSLRLKQPGPEFEYPAMDNSLSDKVNLSRMKEFREQVLSYWLSDEGKARRRAERVYQFPTEPNGNFQIDNITPGVYELQCNGQRWQGKSGPEIRREISVAPSTDGSQVDLGTLK